jgi:hypothetical protein
MHITDIEQARDRVAPYVKRTRLERSETLSKHLDRNVFVKLELFQKTGSFKVRGAFNKLLSQPTEPAVKRRRRCKRGKEITPRRWRTHPVCSGSIAVVLMPDSTPRTT